MKFSAKKGSLVLINSSSLIYLDNGDELMYSDLYSIDGVSFNKIDNSEKQRLYFNALIDAYYFFTIVDALKVYPYAIKYDITATFIDPDKLTNITTNKNSNNIWNSNFNNNSNIVSKSQTIIITNSND